MKHIQAILTLTLFVLFALGCTAGDEGKEQTESTETKTAMHEAPHWSYEGDTAPAAWGKISPKWAPCGGGKSQSPIDLHVTMRSDLPVLKTKFKPSSLKIAHNEAISDGINNGHTIQVNFAGGDMLAIGDASYELVQFHFHSPSEHTVDGEHFPMEMHLVHQAADGKLAVVGVFIEEGTDNAAFDPVWSNLPAAKGSVSHFEDVIVDVQALLPTETTTYRYDGSLTTPPCSEGVRWIVMTEPIELSKEQISAFRDIIRGNNRPVQPLNERSILTDRLDEK